MIEQNFLRIYFDFIKIHVYKLLQRTSVVFMYSSALLSSEKMESQQYNWK